MRQYILAIISAVAIAAFAPQAHAHGGGNVTFGFRTVIVNGQIVMVPVQSAPVVYASPYAFQDFAPAPVIVQAAPVVVRARPVIVRPRVFFRPRVLIVR